MPQADGNSEHRCQRYRQSARCLDAAVEDWLASAGEISFALNLGDIIDGNVNAEATEADFRRIVTSFDRLVCA